MDKKKAPRILKKDLLIRQIEEMRQGDEKIGKTFLNFF
jgi:hypothetical protein